MKRADRQVRVCMCNERYKAENVAALFQWMRNDDNESPFLRICVFVCVWWYTQFYLRWYTVSCCERCAFTHKNQIHNAHKAIASVHTNIFHRKHYICCFRTERLFLKLVVSKASNKNVFGILSQFNSDLSVWYILYFVSACVCVYICDIFCCCCCSLFISEQIPKNHFQEPGMLYGVHVFWCVALCENTTFIQLIHSSIS